MRKRIANIMIFGGIVLMFALVASEPDVMAPTQAEVSTTSPNEVVTITAAELEGLERVIAEGISAVAAELSAQNPVPVNYSRHQFDSSTVTGPPLASPSADANTQLESNDGPGIPPPTDRAQRAPGKMAGSASG